MTTITEKSEKPFTISQIKAYIPIVLDMKKFNYDVWRELFETHCITFSVLKHIDGTGKPSPEIATAWKERDGLVKMWIYGTLSKSLLDTVMQAKCTTSDLWLSIENIFRDNKEARSLQCDHELRTTTIGDLSVHDNCHKLKNLADLLANLDSPVTDRVLVMHLLNGLSDKYDNIINFIKQKTPFPTFSTARSMLIMEEDRLAKQSKPQPNNNDSSSAPAVLYTASEHQHLKHPPHQGRGGYNNRGRGNRNNRGRGVIMVIILGNITHTDHHNGRMDLLHNGHCPMVSLHTSRSFRWLLLIHVSNHSLLPMTSSALLHNTALLLKLI
ncbi:PREDICTED: uncharacterized protein LOC104739875 [Camelina sativa]|uniref:Uncharacterized protein LOC104739875 n=1 Tax=Camelina sativa TaxID=90675 RepID=A0ABM0VN09_CAMSA|nr:PREDICTED: uncharacterized protein LOC104739875 [Camelina sativa]